MQINPRPQEVPWNTPLDQDEEHATYDPAHVSAYFAAATRAALVLSALRAPYRGRSSPVNAWWGSFDLAVSLFSGRPAEPASGDFIMRNAGDAQQIEVGWWPGDLRYPRAAFFAYAYPAPAGFAAATLSPAAARWDAGLGEYVLDWDDARASPDSHGPRWSSAGPRSGMRARSAAGIRRWLPACKESPRQSLTGPQPGGMAPSSRRTTPRSGRSYPRLAEQFADARDDLVAVQLDVGHELVMRQARHAVLQVEPGGAQGAEVRGDLVCDGFGRADVQCSVRPGFPRRMTPRWGSRSRAPGRSG